MVFWASLASVPCQGFFQERVARRHLVDFMRVWEESSAEKMAAKLKNLRVDISWWPRKHALTIWVSDWSLNSRTACICMRLSVWQERPACRTRQRGVSGRLESSLCRLSNSPRVQSLSISIKSRLRKVSLCGHVSSADQSEVLEREMQSLRDYVASHGARLYGKLAARRNRVVRARKVLL